MSQRCHKWLTDTVRRLTCESCFTHRDGTILPSLGGIGSIAPGTFLCTRVPTGVPCIQQGDVWKVTDVIVMLFVWRLDIPPLAGRPVLGDVDPSSVLIALLCGFAFFLV